MKDQEVSLDGAEVLAEGVALVAGASLGGEEVFEAAGAEVV